MPISTKNISVPQKVKIQFMIKSQMATQTIWHIVHYRGSRNHYFIPYLSRELGAIWQSASGIFQHTTSGGMDGPINLDFEV